MGLNDCLWLELEQVKCAAKITRPNIIACELWVEEVGILCIILYRNQWPVNFILYFAELHRGSSHQIQIYLV